MKMIILWLLARITMIEKIKQLRNNPHIKDNINKYNYEREIVGDEIFQNLNRFLNNLIIHFYSFHKMEHTLSYQYLCSWKPPIY